MTPQQKAKAGEERQRGIAAEIARRTQQINAAKRMLAAKQSRDSLLRFIEFGMPDPNHPDDVEKSLYDAQPHHRIMCEIVEKIERGELLRVLLSVPPQRGKSEITTRRGPAWMVGKKPHRHIMVGAYNQDFANEFGEDVRSIINSNEFRLAFPGVEFRTGSKAKDHMVTSRGGKLSFLGRGGSGTGRPADIFIVDDPIKNDEEAQSQTVRDSIWKWFTRTVHSRCHGETAIIVIHTRWSEDDIIGRLTDPTNPNYDKDESAKWLHINIPAIMEPGNEELAKSLGLKIGEPLWPERFPLPLLESAKRLDPLGFSALYMGRPTPPEGAFFKLKEHIHFYRREQLPAQDTCRFYGSGDLAVSPEKNADKSCVGNWGIDPDDTAWLWPELYWERQAADHTVDVICQYAKQFNWLTFFGEKGVIDRSVGPFLKKRMVELEAHFHIETFPTAASKAARAIPFRGRAAQRKIMLPGFMPWSFALRDQMLKFIGEGDKEDDAVDMMGLFGQGLQKILKGRAHEQEPKDNVIRVGSIRWVKYAADQEKAQHKRVAALRGM